VTSTERLHVLIAGGGLSGLALAQGLIKDGHTCEVFERDADDSRKIGYYLHVNADGGEALRRCLPEDLFELYAQTSRRTYDRRESIVLDDQLNELSSQPHLGPPNEGDRPHTGVHRRTLRSILRARLGGSFHPGKPATGYKEMPDKVSVTLADGATAEGDVLVPLVRAIGKYEQEMCGYVYPFMRMTMEHDRQFGGGALQGRMRHDDAQAGGPR
jgi:2-polyprenyl-6-methoxyphenol hydroxylase-like FAD-dependent oxidoreductase